MYTIMDHFFSASDQNATEKFEFYLILRLTFGFLFSYLFLNSLPHLLQNWQHIVLVRKPSWNWANFANGHRQPRYY